MKIIKRFNIISIIFTIASIVAISFLWNYMSYLTFISTEDKVFQQRLQSLENHFENLESKLKYIVVDWAKWDDTYEFIQNNNEKFIEKNLLKNTFSDLELNYILIFNNKNELLYNNYYDDKNDMLTPVNKNEISLFSTYRNKTGLLSIDDKFVLYSCVNVTDSKGVSEPNGYIVFAYDFNKSVIDKLSVDLELPITYNLVHINKSNEIEKSLIRQDSETTTASLIIPLLNKKGNLKLNTTFSNEISKLGFNSSRQILFVLLAVLIIFEIMVYLLLKEKIIKRILNINSQLKNITKNKDVKLRVNIDGKDEFVELKDSINSMLNEIEYMQSELEQYATMDEMTGVYNRRSGLLRLKEYMEQCKFSNSTLTICYIDINNLKKVNDTLGHFYGDLLIEDFSKLLMEVLSEKSIIRLGGDEFLLIFHDNDREYTKLIINKLRTHINEFNSKCNKPYKLSFSFGIESYDNKMSMDDFIRKADINMYKHKNKYKKTILNPR